MLIFQCNTSRSTIIGVNNINLIRKGLSNVLAYMNYSHSTTKRKDYYSKCINTKIFFEYRNIRRRQKRENI